MGSDLSSSSVTYGHIMRLSDSGEFPHEIIGSPESGSISSVGQCSDAHGSSHAMHKGKRDSLALGD